MSKNFLKSLDRIFHLEENLLGITKDNMIMSNDEMESLIKDGKASLKVNLPDSSIENDNLRQMNNGVVYVKYNDPSASTDNIKWVVHRTKDHTNGKAGYI